MICMLQASKGSVASSFTSVLLPAADDMTEEQHRSTAAAAATAAAQQAQLGIPVVGNRPGILLQQQQNFRRILPLPGHPRKESVSDFENARNVRLLLQRHQEQQQELMSQIQFRYPPASAAALMESAAAAAAAAAASAAANAAPSSSETFSSALCLPGDSFPATGAQLEDISSSDEEESDEDAADLLRRLGQSQARMEQIKRMLVNQRGFIVQALKQLAESKKQQQQQQKQHEPERDVNSCVRCKGLPPDPEERDRTLGSTLRHSAARLRKASPDRLNSTAISGSPGAPAPALSTSSTCDTDDKLCPMCEAAFPSNVDQEQFESHVVEHFCFEDAETLKYVPTAAELEQDDADSK